MSSNSVAALRALLASSSVAAPAPSSADPGGTSFSVGGCAGGGGLPPLSSPMAADLVGVLVFRAGDDRCRGLIGSSNVVCGVVNCGVPLHCTKRATVIEMTGYICRESPTTSSRAKKIGPVFRRQIV